MPDLKDDKRLTAKKKLELVVQAGLQLIPHGIGASLSSLYFGAKQERRFQRLESFYQKLEHDFRDMREDDLKKIKEKIESLDINDRDFLAAIIEEINEKIEREHIEQKINYFKNIFINYIIEPIKINNYDERRFFVDALGSMTLLECELLGSIYSQNKSVEVLSLQRDGADKYAIFGSITKLKNYGFLESTEFRYLAENILNDIVRLTHFGRKFCDFCLRS